MKIKIKFIIFYLKKYKNSNEKSQKIENLNVKTFFYFVYRLKTKTKLIFFIILFYAQILRVFFIYMIKLINIIFISINMQISNLP